MTLRRAHANFQQHRTSVGGYPRRSNLFKAFRTLVFAALCTSVGIAFADFPKVGRNSLQFASGHILAAPKPGVTDGQFRALLAARGARGVERLQGIDVYVVEVTPGSEVDQVAQLITSPDMRFAELDALALPAGALTATQSAREWHLKKIDAQAAWGVSTGTGISIAILDSGVDQTHPDLSNRTLQGRSFVGSSDDTTDLTGHGTAVAGAAAAAPATTGGVAGVARGARILPVRVADANGAYWSATAKGLIWAADQGAKVANISYEGLAASRSVQAAATYFGSRGGLVVVAAGNSGSIDNTAPTDAMIVVSATDDEDRIANWSTFGDFVDISAPGQNVLTTTAGGGYRAWSGTSMAAPIVAGTAALVLASRPELTATAVRHALLATATDLGVPGWDAYYGAGRVNAVGAVSAAHGESLDATEKDSNAAAIAANSTSCVRDNPTVDIATSKSAAGASGRTRAFTVTVTDNDTSPCGVARFLLTETLASGWSATLEPSVISLSPGASASTSLRVSSPPSARSGTYSVTVSAMHGSAPTYAGKASVGYVVADGAAVTASASATKPPCKCAPVKARVGLPGAPIIGIATAGNAQATVNFAPPASDGGNPITSYTVTSKPGNLTATGSASPITVSGLTNGTTYTFTVKATNTVGTGPASAASNAVTPTAPTGLGLPGAPTIGIATAGNAQATISFTPPLSDGGSPITSYTVTSKPGGITATGSASPIIVSGLSNGTRYTFTVQATNAVGTGPASAASNAVTPTAPVGLPGPPTIGIATAGNAQATVSFTPPLSDGGSAITSYKVTSTPGGISATGSASPITVSGLTNGTTYTFTVQAINGVGTGPASAPSNAVTPTGGATNSYSTNFPNTENPISEGGRWINGKTTGLDWQDIETTPGFAFFVAPNPNSYDDATAVLTGTWGPDQFVRTVVRIPNVDPNFAQEIEIRLRSSITAHSSTGYEVLGGSQIVRWNGPLGDFTVLATTGPGGVLHDGDIFEAQMVGNVITAYINGVQVTQAVDSTFTTGNPGMGFFTRNPSASPFGFSSFSAHN